SRNERKLLAPNLLRSPAAPQRPPVAETELRTAGRLLSSVSQGRIKPLFVPVRRHNTPRCASIGRWRSPLITTASLKTQTWKDLAEMAKTKGLSGYHSMKKDELVKLLVRTAKAKAKARAASKAAKPAPRSTAPAR